MPQGLIENTDFGTFSGYGSQEISLQNLDRSMQVTVGLDFDNSCFADHKKQVSGKSIIRNIKVLKKNGTTRS